MKSLAALLLLISSTMAFAGLSDFDISAEGKLLGQQVSNTTDKKRTDQQWAYEVTMFNKSSKDFANLAVKYIVFIKDVPEGARSGAFKLLRKPGSTKADAIKSHAKFTFQTDPVDLSKSQLAAGWTYASGARPRSADSLAGIWIRIFDGDKQIAEFSNPATLQTKEKWDGK